MSTVNGTASNDTFTPGQNNILMTYNGLGGLDTLFVDSNTSKSMYTITQHGTEIWVDSVSAASGVHWVLNSVEKINFQSGGIVDLTTMFPTAFPAADVTPPTVASFNPVDGASGFAVNANIVVTFNEAIKLGAGNIVIKDANGVVIETYNVAAVSHPNLVISGSVLTINPTADLAFATGYSVEFAAGTIMDIAGNSYAGTTAYNFTTAAPPDVTPPTVTIFSPADAATGVAVSANIVVTFNEAVQLGTGSIVIKDGNGTVIATYDAGAVSHPNLSISGSILTINPTADLSYGTGYTVEFAAGSIKDVAGNSYAGTTAYNFTTVATDIVAPTVATFSPADGTSGAAVGADIVVTFNEAVQLGSGSIVIKDGNGTVIATYDAGAVSHPNLSISGSVLTINPTADLAYASGYSVEFSAGTIKDLAGNSFAGTAAYHFTTEPVPVVNGTALADTLTAGVFNAGVVINGLAGNDTITGGAGNDVLNGGDGNDVLHDGSGLDTLNGGLGNDTYVVSNSATVINEALAQGVDLVQSSVSYTLSANVENLQLTGGDSTNAIGNDLANVLTGNAGNNMLTGMGGADRLLGGAGDDTYVIDLVKTGLLAVVQDIVTEGLGGGNDTIQLHSANLGLAAASTLLLGANIENLDASDTSTTLINLTGNTLSNILTGNAGNNVLNGVAGVGAADTMIGGAGNDTYIVNKALDVVTENVGEGTDQVRVNIATAGGTYVLGDNIENGSLISAVAYNLTGNAADNVLAGNALANILDGGSGLDKLSGGLGNDTYIVDNAGDVVTEAALAGIDTVRSSISYALGANVENLVLTGSTSLTGTGNALNNVITDNGAADTLVGGLGNDTYVVSNSATVINEALAQGVDLVQSSVSYTLSANVENLQLTGGDSTNAIGNDLANVLTGNAGNNMLTGMGGADRLLGGAGDDTYVIDLVKTGLLAVVQDIVTEGLGGGNDTIQLHSANLGLAAASTLLLGANIENLDASDTSTTLINLTGNTLSNILTGNAGNNVLNGVAGVGAADTMIGGAGNDTYIVNKALDVVTENVGEGTDQVRVNIATAGGTYVLGDNIENGSLISAVAYNLTGNAADNVLVGNALANILDGGSGLDKLSGGLGNDTYIVDNAGDVVIEAAAAGIDTVKASIDYSLATLVNVENVTLTGSSVLTATGNALANVLTDNGAADTLIGGLGNDTYVVSNSATVVAELAAQGIDLVQSFVSYTLSANVEKLTLTGSGNTNATGNDLANVLTGNAGNNILNGMGGADTLIGGLGNDTYVIDLVKAGTAAALQDIVTEGVGAGSDTIQLHSADLGLAVATTLVAAANIENLDASDTSTTKLNLTGNALANLLTGNAADNVLSGLAGTDTLDGGNGNDLLIGGAGNDTLTGGAGADIFRFESALSATTNVDTINDFASGTDRIQLENAIFTKLTTLGTLAAANFVSSASGAAVDANDYVLYNTTTGVLSYDADGSGAGAAVQIVTLVGIPAISATDFVVT